MDDLGAPMAYLTIEKDLPVVASDGARIGKVEHVLAEDDADIFEGLVIDTRLGPGGHRFVDAPQIAEIREGGIVLALDAAAAERLPEPGENPAAMSADPDDTAEGELQRKLRRAWDRISGNV
ncbi:MAG: hypothetical protein QOD81_3661 [Solirubrobacteraceae bacterium]|jgi:hypothetical protein|nr:hypothetical protein [Solirubrobacteraceae bacterium]